MFNKVRNLFSIRRNLEDPRIPLSQAYDLLNVQPSASGVLVNAETVLGNPYVYRAVDLLSSKVGLLPTIVYKRLGDDDRERAKDHPAYRLLKKQPAPLTTAIIFKSVMMHDALIYGNAYALIHRDPLGRPTEFEILAPKDTMPAKEDGVLVYIHNRDGRQFKLSPADIIHIKGLSACDWYGIPVIEVLRDSLGLGISLIRHGNAFFKNNGLPSLVVELPPWIKTEKQVAEWKRAWGNIHQGIGNAWRPAMMMGGKLTPITVDNEKSQWLQSRELDAVTVGMIFGVHPNKLGAQISTNYNSLEMTEKESLADHLERWLVQFEQELELKLLSEEEKALDTHYVEFLREKLIQITTAENSSILLSEYHGGGISWEEYRAKRNMTTERDEDQHWLLPTSVHDQNKPPEPELSPQLPPPPEDPPQEEPEEDEDVERSVRELTRKTIKRLLDRSQRAVTAGKPLQDQKDYWLDNLPFSRSATLVEALFSGLDEELSAVLPEQRAEAFGRVDVDKLAEDLWTTKS